MFGKKTFFVLAGFMLPLLLLSGSAADEAILRQENRELRERLLQQEKELKQLKLWMANAASAGANLSSSEREQYSLRIINEMMLRGKELAMRADNISTQLRRSLDTLPLKPAQRVRLVLRLDELDGAVRQYISFVTGSGKTDACRVISFDRNLGIAVLSAGIEQGFSPGMVFQPAGKKSDLRLRIISVRPGIAAAELISGSWNEVVSGMAVTAFLTAPQSAR